MSEISEEEQGVMFGGTDHIDHILQVCSPYFSISISKGETNVLQILFK